MSTLLQALRGILTPCTIDDEYAKSTFFKGRIVHGLLTGSFISTVLGMKLPGPNTIYLSQSLKFLAPVKIGDTIQVEVEVTEKIDAKRQISLSTVVKRQDGVIAVDGEALVMKKAAL